MKYNRKTGEFTSDIGSLFGIGYAGFGVGKNNPDKESVKNIGPLPKGKYTIGQPYNSAKTGPFTLPLTPFPENEMYGRSAFQIHGDNGLGTASHGCIILPRAVREEIHNCTDKILTVI